jgi:tetratricopeptide (TPR) repeat protein
LDDAREQLEAVLRIRPNASDAHEFLGTVLAAQGQLDRAIEHYREAIRIQPEFSRAHLHLGEALADSGHAAEAVLDLRKAAVSSDGAIRDEAFKALEKIEKGR